MVLNKEKREMIKRGAVWVLAGVLAGILAVLLVVAAAAETPDFAEFDRRAKAGERLNVVFFGASLTYGANASDPQHTSYRALVQRRLEETYPKAHFRCYDASIGRPGSDLGVFRLDRDVLSREPDLVFLGFAPNDGSDVALPNRLATWEAIMRRCIIEAKAPVVAVLFPFQWEVQWHEDTSHLRANAERTKIAAAYNMPVADAAALIVKRVNEKQATIQDFWPWDQSHVGDKGYEQFARSAWTALQGAIRNKVVCKTPEKMLQPDTFLRSARVRISSLGPLPKGWTVGKPLVQAVTYDWLMSRWLDDVVVVRQDGAEPGTAEPGPPVAQARLKVRFSGTDVFMFGQSTPASCKYRVYIDGKRVYADPKTEADSDAAHVARMVSGNTFLWQNLARNLSADKEHTLEIEPVFETGMKQEFMPESICVAGGEAWVKPAE